MTTLIIQGTKFETDKTLDVLKSTFHIVNKKTSYTSEMGLTSIVEIQADEMHVNSFSTDEILKALVCCSNAVRDCATCPYKKVNDCKKRLQLDGAVLITKVKAGELKL